MQFLSFNYSHIAFYLVLFFAIVVGFYLAYFVYHKTQRLFIYIAYAYAAILVVAYFVSKAYYVDMCMNGVYFLPGDPTRYAISEEIEHRYYLALILRLYLGMLIGLAVFNTTCLRKKSFMLNLCVLLACVILSLRFGIEDSIFFEEGFLPSLLFFAECALYVAILVGFKLIKTKINA
ncbi:hypothetical protein HPU229336_00145 [Helicobacter pullorum]|uniref:Integral membrane protein n=1 Tax=Helicobacter pullorum TaxID=35818 RepID=A0AAW3J8F8_9HELI|nr:hypothetical protein [Helicobacter pullorum]KPH51559.1 hypothetical protein HPU229336_00145 [Helicobacter pullorum]